MPVLALPLTYEQGINAQIVKNKQIGTVLNYRRIDEHTLENAIKYLLHDQTVKTNVGKLSAQVNYSRTGPLEVSIKSVCKDCNVVPKEGVWWSEYVMKWGGCVHLKSPYRHNSYTGNMIFCTQILIALLSIYIVSTIVSA